MDGAGVRHVEVSWYSMSRLELEAHMVELEGRRRGVGRAVPTDELRQTGRRRRRAGPLGLQLGRSVRRVRTVGRHRRRRQAAAAAAAAAQVRARL